MLVLTISKRDEAGRSTPIIAISDPTVISQVFEAVRALLLEEEEMAGQAEKAKGVIEFKSGKVRP